MKKNLVTACLYTLITAVVLGIFYPLLITGVAHLVFRDKAEGQLITKNGELIGSRIIGQPFTGTGYFHSRPSAAGTGYDGMSSSGSNLSSTSKQLVDRINTSVATERNGDADVPIDLVTASGSGLDPDISPASALAQVQQVARARGLGAAVVRRVR